MKDITLIFPQWQGSIDNMALYEGAIALAGGIENLPCPLKIETPPFRQLPTEGGIAGRSDIIAQLHQACETLRQNNPDRILLLGGDCSTETAPVTWFSQKYGHQLALIWIDAHPDLNTPATSQSGRLQGMALSVILGNAGEDITNTMFSPLKPKQVFCLGSRLFDPPEFEFIAERKIPFFGPGELERDPSWLAAQIELAGFSKVYIHLDVDAVNPIGFAHGKPSPPAGLPFSNILNVIDEIDRRLDICGLGITEFHPGSESGIAKAAKLVDTTLKNFRTAKP